MLGLRFSTPRICPLDCVGDDPWPGSVILDSEIHQKLYDPLPWGEPVGRGGFFPFFCRGLGSFIFVFCFFFGAKRSF